MPYYIGVQISYGQQTGNAKNSPNDQLAADTNQVNPLLKQANFYFFTKPDSSLILSTKAIELAQQLGFSSGEAKALNLAGEGHHMLGDLPQSLEIHFRALEINLNNKDKMGEAITRGYIGFSYVDLNEYRQALPYLNEARIIFEKFGEPIHSTLNLANIGGAYEGMNMLDSALFFHKQALARSEQIKFMPLTGLFLADLE